MAISPYCWLTTPDRLRLQESEAGIELAERQGLVRTVAPGLVAGPAAPRWWDEAVAEGWRPTCLSAAEMHGLWIPRRTGNTLHAYRLRTRRDAAPKGVVAHRWHRAWPEATPAASIPLLLEHAAYCLDIETCLVLADSALHLELLDERTWQGLLPQMPAKRRTALRRARSTAHSGSETRVGHMLDRRRIPFEPQAHIPGVGHVDLLVKGIWVIECDSQAHHSAPRDHDYDRQRDLSLQGMGYIVTRLSFPQIWYAWDDTTRRLLRTWQAVRYRTRRPHAA